MRVETINKADLAALATVQPISEEELLFLHDDDEPDDPAYDFEGASSECGMEPDGHCALAGSEHCEFRCPFNHAR